MGVRLWFAFMLFAGASAGTLLTVMVLTGNALYPFKELRKKFSSISSNVTMLFVMEITLAILCAALTLFIK
ncbi:hypothetical protein [Caldicellulosiruptor morganii]|uniref:Uncharacterized protein n=1 Tax=Caldicellulosiruptor morganii TaxID=1387555 RepID=A0ABY7BP41_9FIRM|nr:hypothetical protein [Caldicellulosiruptor morganii]WAM33306.1 hypothetical protein OTK00_001801 [Caldicellulosiruptor morganii]